MTGNSVLSGCIKVEKTAAAIYKKFARLFPDHKELWTGLFDDEVQHLAFLKDVKSLGLTSELQKRGPLPSVPVISRALKLADSIIEKTEGTSFPMNKALKMVLKLEESLVETYTNKAIADLMSCGNETSLKKLVAEETAHLRKIKRMMQSK